MQVSAIDFSLSLWNPAWVGFTQTSKLPRLRSPLARVTRSHPDEPTRALNLVAPGTHDVTLTTGMEVRIDDTGVSVMMEDLDLAHSEQRNTDGNVTYRLPARVPKGRLTIEGSQGDDVIKVRQDNSGDTVVEVTNTGVTKSLNLGRVAALTLQANAGKDKVEVDVKDYFGGITVEGGAGNDTIEVKAARSLQRGVTVRGDAGDDTITLSGSAFRVLANGGSGDDEINALSMDPPGSWSRVLQGGAGNDRLIGSPGNNWIQGGAGDDTLLGGRGNDRIQGGAGDDLLTGLIGDDQLEGEDGNDLLLGDGGNDVLVGGSGDDLLYGGNGSDKFYGGAGTNTFAPAAASPNEIRGYGRVGSHLLVMARGEPRSQPVLTTYAFTGKILFDYRSDSDTLLDRNFVV